MKIALLTLLVPLVGCASASSPDVTSRENGDDASSSLSSGAGDDDDDGGDPVPVVPAPPASTIGADALLAEARSIVATMTATKYQHSSSIDPKKGIYDVDCSGFLDYALGVSVSDAYDVLVKATTSRPVAESYVSFIADLSAAKETADGRWSNVPLVKSLAPGDILAWRIPAGVKSSDTGHIMIVEKSAVIVGNQAEIAIIDSTETGHGDIDPRLPTGPSGIGRGTTVVMMNADGTAYGYRWSTDSDSPPYTTEVVMAHLK